MKTNCWLVLGAMIASSAIAQNNTNTLPAMPAPVATPAAEVSTPVPVAPPVPADSLAVLTGNAPGKKAAPAKPKKVVAPRKINEPKVALVPGPAEVMVSNLVVRGQAGLQGELVTHLSKGDAVTVLSQINLDKHAADEPAHWAKIALPSTVHVWLNGKYIDQSSKVVSAKKLNLRAGPGENYSVVGLLEKGAPVSGVETKGDWIKIEAPTNAYAFVAAMYLKQVAAAPVVASTAPPMAVAPAPTPTPVPEATPIVTEPAPVPTVAVSPPVPAPAVVETSVPPSPASPRIATHEGVVRHVSSLITPTEYELYDPTTGKNVNFLHTTTTNLDLSHYVGMRIIVTGEEGLAARWADIPVLTIQRILVIDTNAVPKVIYRSPRQSQRR